MVKKIQGITVKKDVNFNEWYTQVIQKSELIDYSPVSGCYVIRPRGYAIWEKVQNFFDKLIKADGVKNSYFPLFIPESLLQKEANHIEGFAPEVAWVESGGNTKLKERLAIRPTSETIMYDSYARWIRSYNDLPLRLNQWTNVVRWEFKHPQPFIRGREFLWQEGHTVFATKEEAVLEAKKILGFYERVYRELYALPTLLGKKSENEKFAGADFSLSVESIMPNGKAVQAATSHHLGQNFSKSFDISFVDKDQKKKYGWQNSWGISTRSIGAMVMIHSDDKGLVLPPKIANTQVVIVPILFKDSQIKVLKQCEKVKGSLEKNEISVKIDLREEYSPGWKFNEWELKGVPIRIEIGPRDLENDKIIAVRRDTGEKQELNITNIGKEVSLILKQIHDDLYKNAEKMLKNSIIQVDNLNDAKRAIAENKIIFVPWCGSIESEEKFKEETGAKSLNSPLEQPSVKGKKCFITGSPAKVWFYFGKSY